MFLEEMQKKKKAKKLKQDFKRLKKKKMNLKRGKSYIILIGFNARHNNRLLFPNPQLK